MPVSLLADEDVDGNVLHGLLLRKPDLDIIRVQDVGLSGKDDRDILEWAAQQRRVLLTYDKRTVINHVKERIRVGRAVPGVIMVKRRPAIGLTIEHILLMLEASLPEEWENQIRYVPL
ncbi:MAG TPA: DUF5615 family PIN-like protein [Chloroflexia bacterium]|nr:DUF5615 family PIN-like protein [Chloroflexia bacterium]